VTGPVRGPGEGVGVHECEYAVLLSAFLDGELTDDERTAVERHLREYVGCRRELGEVAQVRAAVRGLPWIDGPAEFWSELAVESSLEAAAPSPVAPPARPAVAAARTAPRPAPAARRRAGSSVRWLWGSAAAAFLLVAAGVAGTQVDHASSSTPRETTPSISAARTGAQTYVGTTSSAPVGQQLVAHNDGVDDAMDGVAKFLRMP